MCLLTVQYWWISILQKVQHSHPRHQKTTSNLKRHIQWNMATRGSYVHNSMGRIFGGIPKMYAIFSENWWFQTKRFTGLLELIQLYKQNPLENCSSSPLTQTPKLYIGFKEQYSFICLFLGKCCQQKNTIILFSPTLYMSRISFQFFFYYQNFVTGRESLSNTDFPKFTITYDPRTGYVL